jgi:threonine aldolase
MQYTKHPRGFASDNNAPVHPDIMEAMQRVNRDHTIGYGDDPWTTEAAARIAGLFGGEADVFFVFTGTGANVLALSSTLSPWHSVLCAGTAHIHEDECGAPERFTGSKVIPLPQEHGKITPALVEEELFGFGFEHHSQPRVISISQTTERSTVYTAGEIRALADLAHHHGMILHVDGARIANAVAALDISLEEMITRTGVDILSFGGTKNGMMYGEAVVILNRELSEGFRYIRKQGMQLASKMRYIAAQFLAYLDNDLWLKNARHANRMATLLGREAAAINNISILHPVEANGVFASLPSRFIPLLQEEYFFYLFDEKIPAVRWMTSWDTRVEDVRGFLEVLREKVGRE